jgi:methanogenic corrinoid protein MtbC1
MGGTTEGDNYNVPTTLVELVLQQAGWRTIQLGVSLPAETICAAVEDHHPQMVWLSVSHIADRDGFVSQYARIQEVIDGSAKIAIGGRALTEEVRRQVKSDIFCDSLTILQEFASKHCKSAPELSSRSGSLANPAARKTMAAPP